MEIIFATLVFTSIQLLLSSSTCIALLYTTISRLICEQARPSLLTQHESPSFQGYLLPVFDSFIYPHKSYGCIECPSAVQEPVAVLKAAAPHGAGTTAAASTMQPDSPQFEVCIACIVQCMHLRAPVLPHPSPSFLLSSQYDSAGRGSQARTTARAPLHVSDSCFLLASRISEQADGQASIEPETSNIY